MATLKLSSNFLNNYENAYNVLSKSAWFDQSEWTKHANNGDLDMYITGLADSKNINTSEIWDKLKLDFADPSLRTDALYNELWSDRTNVDVDRERYKKNPDGTFALDDNDKPIVEHFKASDYEYRNYVIAEKAELNFKQYLLDQEAERKKSLNGFAKFAGTIASLGTTFMAGTGKKLDGIGAFFGGISEGINALFTGHNISDAIAKGMSDKQYRYFEASGALNTLTDFERKYTYMRNIDGNYSGFGKYVGGVLDTLGQMLPAAVSGSVSGNIANTAGASANVAQSISEGISSFVFYEGITADNVREAYEKFTSTGVSTPTSQILFNSILKSAAQYGIEKGLAQILGGTAIDNMVFGRSVKTNAGRTLTSSGISRLAGDFVEEGLEEVFQDTSDFLIDQAFGLFVDSNFGKLSNVTIQSLVDSFVLGGLASFAGSAAKILVTDNVESSQILYDKNGNIKFDKNGNVRFKRLNKLASWELGLDMQSFAENCEKLMNYGEGAIVQFKPDSKEAKQYNAAFTEMYAAYRMITSVYAEIGEERFKAANDVLTNISAMIRDGKFSNKVVSVELLEQLKGNLQIATINDELQKEITKANMTELAYSVNKDNMDTIKASESTKKEIATILNESDIKNVVVTKDGTNVVKSEDTIIVPKNYIETGGANAVFATDAEQSLIKGIVTGKYKGTPVDNITDFYRQMKNDANASAEDAIRAVLYDQSMFSAILQYANKDTYLLLASLDRIADDTVPKNLQDTIFKNKLNATIVSMKRILVEYLVNQPNANIDAVAGLSPEQISYIAKRRYCSNLYNRVVNDKTYAHLTKDDWTVLENRVNSMPTSKADKESILRSLKQGSSDARAEAMNSINNAYNNIFKAKYDGETYMPETSLPNCVFNAFLQSQGLTIKTLLDINALDDSAMDALLKLNENDEQAAIMSLRLNQFSEFCGDKYVFGLVNKNKNIAIYEKDTLAQVGFSNYYAQQNAIKNGNKLSERDVVITDKTNRNALVKELLSENVDASTAAYASIDDVIKNPNMLSDDLRNKIMLKFKKVDTETAYLYLRNYFIDKLKTTTIVELQDGSFGFANISPMLSLLKNTNFQFDTNKKSIRIRDIIAEEYLQGSLVDVVVKLTNAVPVGEYRFGANTIFINKDIAEQGGRYAQFVLLHEFQHAIQFENKMNMGIDAKWITNNAVSPSIVKAIVKDVRKHRPDLFKNAKVGSEQELQIVNDFVYYSSGESTAMGIDGSTLLDYYPTFVTINNKGTTVRFPWGATYNLTQLPMSLYTSMSAFDIELTPEDTEKYKAVASTILNELDTNSGKASKTFASIFTKSVSDANLELRKIMPFIQDVKYLAALDEAFKKLSLSEEYVDTYKLLKTLSAKQLLNYNESFNKSIRSGFVTAKDIGDLYNKYSTDTRLTDISKLAFDKLQQLALFNPSTFRLSYHFTWGYAVYSYTYYSQYTVPEAAYVRTNALYYNIPAKTAQDSAYTSDVQSFANTLLHETLHYITSETIRQNNSLRSELESLYDIVKDKAINDFVANEHYGLISLNEFVAECSNPEFRGYLQQIGRLDQYLSIVRKLLNVSNLDITNYKHIENKVATGNVELLNDIIADMEYSDGRTSEVTRNYNPLQIAKEKQGNTTIYNIIDTRTDQKLAAFEGANNAVVEVMYQGNGIWHVYKDRAPKMVVRSQSIVPLSSQLQSQSMANIKPNNYAEQLLIDKIQENADALLNANADITYKELSEALLKQFKFVDSDLLNDILSDYKIILESTEGELVAGTTLDELNEDAKNQIEDSTTKKPQNRARQAISDENDIIYNNSENGAWTSKRPRRNANGDIIHDAKGQIVYTYTYNRSGKNSRYVSQRAYKGTNLEKYGYIAKYGVTQMSPALRDFIVKATPDIASELWDKLTARKLTIPDIMDYLYTANTIDDVTFKLIRDNIFKNNKIESFEHLKTLIEKETPKYYALRVVLRKMGYNDAITANANPQLFEKLVDIVTRDPELKNTYEEIKNRYYFTGDEKNRVPLVIDEKNLRRLWLTYFDGSVNMGAYLADVAKVGAICKWVLASDGNSLVDKSLNEEIAEDLTLGDTVKSDAKDAFDTLYNSVTFEEKVTQIMTVLTPKIVRHLLREGKSKAFIEKTVTSKANELRNNYMEDDKAFKKMYARYVRGMTQEEIDKLFARELVAEVSGLKLENANDGQIKKLADIANMLMPTSKRTSRAIKNNIVSMNTTIKSNLTVKAKKLFLKENGEYFDENANVKTSLLKNEDGTLKNKDELLELENTVRQLSKDVRSKIYSTADSLNIFKKLKNELAIAHEENAKLIEKLASSKNKNINAKPTKPVVINFKVSDEQIVVRTDKAIPPVLKTLLDTEFTKTAKSTTQYIIEGDERHIRTSLNTFLEDNAETLQYLSQSDAEEIADFYLTSDIVPDTNKVRTYSAIQVYMMTYLIKGNKNGDFQLSEETRKKLQQRLQSIVSVSAQNLSNWEQAMKMLAPAKVIAMSLARSSDITITEDEVEALIAASESGDIKRLQTVKTSVYGNVLARENAKPQSVLMKILAFERLAMLSGPGTWVRNISSNLLVTAGNEGGAYIGKSVAKLIDNLLFKNEKLRSKYRDGYFKYTRERNNNLERQYVLTGTKLTPEVSTFIEQRIKQSGLLDLISDGFTKFDTRPSKYTKTPTLDDSIAETIAESVRSQIFQQTTFKTEAFNKLQNIVMSALSDSPFINKTALRYFGKMLVEDEINLDNGLTKPILIRLADAYKLAAFDYMHKQNFFNRIESRLHAEIGNTAYFMYKQVFPFSSASWNWFVEGLKYTPVGLFKAVSNYVKLENTIESFENKRSKDGSLPSSRFAEYLTKRDIGKGVIGSIGTFAGMLLGIFGVARIENDDDTYKLFIEVGGEKIAVDISDMFSTQGILLGIAMTSFKKGEKVDYMKFMSSTLDALFLDSTFTDLFNSFRYSDSFGEWLVNEPFSILQMLIPNFVKTFSSIVQTHNVKYSKGILGKIEQFANKSVPFLSYAFPKVKDIYSGETQYAYKMPLLTNLINKVSPIKVYAYNISDIEKEAIAVGVKKTVLSGRYTIDGNSINLDTKELEQLNEFYGKLNKKELTALMENKGKYKVLDKKKNEYVELYYRQMSTEQKKTVIERIMSDNSQTAKIYVLTNNNFTYYATDAEYDTFKKLGIKNVKRKTDKKKGLQPT